VSAPGVIVVHRASADQASAVATLHAQLFHDGWSASAIAKVLAAPAAYLGVANILGRDHTAGFVICSLAADEMEILSIGVAPALQRRGIADSLLEAAAAHAVANGVTRIFLEVAVDNDAARALYRSHAFVEVGLRKAYYARPVGERADALVLVKSLI
jgi:[ribosomal protein S18]-alanine N-acetyltransferase